MDTGYKTDQKMQARHQKLLSELTRLPGNSTCADCGGRFPRFASVTLGIFLCNRCYAIHRNVGAHVTRTKCIGLDAWSSEEIATMTAVGNARADAYWACQVPAGRQRPIPESPDSVAEAWIRDKYERKRFCPSDRAPPSVRPTDPGPELGVESQPSRTVPAGNAGGSQPGPPATRRRGPELAADAKSAAGEEQPRCHGGPVAGRHVAGVDLLDLGGGHLAVRPNASARVRGTNGTKAVVQSREEVSGSGQSRDRTGEDSQSGARISGTGDEDWVWAEAPTPGRPSGASNTPSPIQTKNGIMPGVTCVDLLGVLGSSEPFLPAGASSLEWEREASAQRRHRGSGSRVAADGRPMPAWNAFGQSAQEDSEPAFQAQAQSRAGVGHGRIGKKDPFADLEALF